MLDVLLFLISVLVQRNPRENVSGLRSNMFRISSNDVFAWSSEVATTCTSYSRMPFASESMQKVRNVMNPFFPYPLPT